MTALIEQLASDKLDRGPVSIAYSIGTAVAAFLLIAIS